ncbi:hypothetical protein DFJ69_5590 [Thermomonospora umbrina]|uniref:Uncharacterized protein n=1 Tax=Thermomonospora umbrina TaxID=111806 RepID=A0A3D9SVV4_9ACTN|nr:hypothetical protein DFJ69_5590 [Thermomonospora umbrina]
MPERTGRRYAVDHAVAARVLDPAVGRRVVDGGRVVRW